MSDRHAQMRTKELCFKNHRYFKPSKNTSLGNSLITIFELNFNTSDYLIEIV